jgi:LemA protein
MAVIVIVIIVVLMLALWLASTYNNLVGMRNLVKNGWAQIDVQLKQRADLIPNLVETVKGYASHESSVLEEVTRARSHALAAAQTQASPEQRAAAENELSRAIINLNAVAENYPQLQANQNFLDLQNQLKQIEQKIAYARQMYNDVVLKYNNSIQMFPSNIVAGMFHFIEAQFFSVTGQDREVPKVSFAAPGAPASQSTEGPFAKFMPDGQSGPEPFSAGDNQRSVQ